MPLAEEQEDRQRSETQRRVIEAFARRPAAMFPCQRHQEDKAVAGNQEGKVRMREQPLPERQLQPAEKPGIDDRRQAYLLLNLAAIGFEGNDQSND